MAFSIDRNRMLFKRILSALAIFKTTFKLFGSQGRSNNKKLVDFFPVFSLYEKRFESTLTVV